MTYKEFAKIAETQMENCTELLSVKAEEYTPSDPDDTELVEDANGQPTFGFAADDRLRHFKKAAVLMGVSPKAALLGMLSKHLVSVADMCMSNEHFSRARWSEKITDSMNYLILLRALVEEEAREYEADTSKNP